jgi:ATP-dependent RNA helicase DeaD
MARAEEKQRPIAPINEVQTSPKKRASRRSNARGSNGERNGSRRSNGSSRSHEAGMVRLSLSRGRAHGIRPNEVVSSIAHYANIPGNSIGRISIEDKHTLVDVPEQFAPQVLAKTGSYRIKRQAVSVERA